MTKEEALQFLSNTKIMVGYKGEEFMNKINSIFDTNGVAPDYPFAYIYEKGTLPVFGSSPRKFTASPNKELLLSDVFDIEIEEPMKQFEEADIVCDKEHEIFALLGKGCMIEALYYSDENKFISVDEFPAVREDIRTFDDIEYATDEEVTTFYSQAFLHGYVTCGGRCSKSFKEGSTYYYLVANFTDSKLVVVANRNSDSDLDWNLWKSGNYFLTKEAAENEAIKYRQLSKYLLTES